MQGRITQIQRFSVHDGPGIRTTVFFKGCNLRCIWCHNPETYTAKTELEYFANRCTQCGRCITACPNGARQIANGEVQRDKDKCTLCFSCEAACVNGALDICGKDYSPEELCDILKKDIKYYQKSGGGVTFSGGEPLLQSEFVFRCAEILQEAGIPVAVETASNLPEPVLRQALDHVSLFMCDIKAMDPNLHKQLTGVTNERILSNLRMLAAEGASVLVRIPVAMGLNGTKENIRATAKFMKENGLYRIELLKLHRLSDHKYSALDLPTTHPDVPETTDEDIEAFYQIFQEYLGDSMRRGF